LKAPYPDPVLGNGDIHKHVSEDGPHGDQLEAAASLKSSLGQRKWIDVPTANASFPPPLYGSSISSNGLIVEEDADDADEDRFVAQSSQRAISPSTSAQKIRAADDASVGTNDIVRMHKFSLYETSTRFYVVGVASLDTRLGY
jgi:hypothetical protein